MRWRRRFAPRAATTSTTSRFERVRAIEDDRLADKVAERLAGKLAE
jgi:hypothetical protein